MTYTCLFRHNLRIMPEGIGISSNFNADINYPEFIVKSREGVSVRGGGGLRELELIKSSQKETVACKWMGVDGFSTISPLKPPLPLSPEIFMKSSKQFRSVGSAPVPGLCLINTGSWGRWAPDLISLINPPPPPPSHNGYHRVILLTMSPAWKLKKSPPVSVQ